MCVHEPGELGKAASGGGVASSVSRTQRPTPKPSTVARRVGGVKTPDRDVCQTPGGLPLPPGHHKNNSKTVLKEVWGTFP